MMSAPQLAGWVFAGQSAAAERLRVQVARMAPHFRTALVIGEPGSGKAEVMRALYKLSHASGALVECAAAELDEAMLDQARSGMLFLTELAAVPTARQIALLEYLRRAARHETRLVCAVESCLKGAVAAGRVRADLYARIATIEIRVAPLRERLEDLRALAGAHTLSDDAVEALRQYLWPGNLAELRVVLERAQAEVAGGTIEVAHLPPLAVLPAASGEQTEVRLEAVMRRHVVEVLERCAGNKLRAAEMLGISRSTLYRMLDGGSVA